MLCTEVDMENISMHSNDELSLRVFNEPYFYNEIHHPEYLMALIKEEFVYTSEQMQSLVEDLDDYLHDIDIQQSLARGETQ